MRPFLTIPVRPLITQNSFRNRNYGGDNVDYLRPTKALPYHPTASHCSYPDTVLAMCDELIPRNSNDSKIPCMTWEDSRNAKGKVVTTHRGQRGRAAGQQRDLLGDQPAIDRGGQ